MEFCILTQDYSKIHMHISEYLFSNSSTPYFKYVTVRTKHSGGIDTAKTRLGHGSRRGFQKPVQILHVPKTRTWNLSLKVRGSCMQNPVLRQLSLCPS